MELTLIAVVGVVSIVAVAVLADRIGIAAPLVLVLVGVGLGFLPGVPTIRISPEVILAGVLPPLLYASATRMPAVDFRRDIKPIASLAVTLVVLTTLCSGYLFSWLIGGLGLAAAFALGAIISPTDAVAATTVGKKLGLPSRLLTILEGEGLVNDASSLVLLASAIAATTETVHIWKIGLQFVYAVAIAVAIGALVGILNVLIRSWLHDSILNTAVSFVVPFLAYLPAEALKASGILAVVITGLVTGYQGPRYLRAQDRIAETINWGTLSFLLESAIFLFMGLQLKTLLDADTTAGLSSMEALWIGLAASALVMIFRVVFVFPLVFGMRRDAGRAAKMKPFLADAEARVDDPEVRRRAGVRDKDRFLLRVVRKRSDIDFYLAEGFGWRGAAVLGWSGMRGAVTVAAAQTLPADTRYRPQLILIAFTVAVTTLLLQGLTLPRLIRVVHVPSDDSAADLSDGTKLMTDVDDRVEKLLGSPDLAQPDGSPYADGVLDRVRGDLRVGTSHADPGARGTSESREQYLTLMLSALAAERDVLLDARTRRTHSSRVLSRAERRLDIEEARMQLFRDTSSD